MDASARRGLLLLGLSVALGWTTVSLIVGPGSAAFVELSGSDAHAGTFVGLFCVAAAGGAWTGGQAMDRYGRKPLLLAGWLGGAAGFAVAGAAVAAGSLPFLVLGTILLAAGSGLTGLTRVAAAELVPPEERGRAVSRVQVAATLGAIAGPLLLIGSGPLGDVLGRDPTTIHWALAPPLLVVAAVLVAATKGLRGAAVSESERESERAIAGVRAGAPGVRPRILSAVLALVCAQAAMSAIMGVTGAALVHGGHGVNALGGVMLLHFTGMFGLSLVVGRAADRVGRAPTIAFGLALIVAGCAVIASGVGAVGLALALLLIGLGWSSSYIGATVLLTDLVPAENRGRVLGRTDLAVLLLAGAASLGAGWWYAERGMDWVGVAGAVVALVPLVPLLKLGRATTNPTTAPQ